MKLLNQIYFVHHHSSLLLFLILIGGAILKEGSDVRKFFILNGGNARIMKNGEQIGDQPAGQSTTHIHSHTSVIFLVVFCPVLHGIFQ